MKNIAASFIAISIMCIGYSAPADNTANPYHPDVASSLNRGRFKLGFQFDVGVPDGAALGLEVRPGVRWLKLGVAGTYNALAPGVRGEATLDPIKFPVAPTLSFDLGRSFEGKVPGTTDSVNLAYTYLNVLPGLEFGSRDGFRFFLRGGVTHMWVDTGNFSNTVHLSDGVTINNPSFNGWVAPAAKLGFSVLF